jgi:hypothetical protein
LVIPRNDLDGHSTYIFLQVYEMDLLLQVTELYGKTTTYFLIFSRGEFT